MKFNKRGQAAVEYLIILAVVIIIALVVVGVLGGFPSLTQGVSERGSAAYWQGADISLVRYAATGTTVSGVIRNGKSFTIRNVVVTLFGTNATATTAYAGTLAPGSSTSSLVTLGTLPTACTAGTPFSVAPVTFQYTDAQYSTVYTFTGANPIAGTCS